MKLLWIGTDNTGLHSGEAIYDRRLLAELSAMGIRIRHYTPPAISRPAEFVNLARDIAHQRARYHSAANIDAVRAAASGQEVAVASWEPFDRLATALPIPVIPILHNITSLSLQQIFRRNPLGRALAWRTAAWERKAYQSSRFPLIAALSMADAAHLRTLKGAPDVIVLPPGAPPETVLAASAQFRPEILVSGRYHWFAKRRDVNEFARELAGVVPRPPVFADDLPREAAALLSPITSKGLDMGEAIRAGIIADRFAAGFKLKSTFYIANNCIVLTYCDIMPDFTGIEDADVFIRRIGHASDVGPIIDEFSRMNSAALRFRFLAFKDRVLARFSWGRTATALAGGLARVLRDSE
jgi:hypothetical protein